MSRPQPTPSATTTPTSTPNPRSIAEALGKRVIGQREAIEEMSIALAKKLGGYRVGNILMIGSSGTGKTTLMRSVEHFLSERPDLGLRPTVVRLHANVLGEEAQRGRPGEAVLGRLMDRAREQLGTQATAGQLLSHAARGIVFVDEVDKIRSHVGGVVNTQGIRAQEALLTLMENEAVPYTLPAWAGGKTIQVDSAGLLFVCAGAFEGLYDAVFDRVTVGRDKGSLRPKTVVEDGRVREKLEFSLREWLRNEDLFDYGMSPQFLARFDAVVLLRDLEVEQLTRIFVEAADSGLEQSREFFRSQGVSLTLAPGAVRRIAEEAARAPRLGARALKEVFRRVIRAYELDPDVHARTGGGAVVIDETDVEAALKR